MKLQEKLTAMKKESMANRPPEIVEILLGEVKKLVDSGIVDQAVGVGGVLPEFTLPDEKGNMVSSKDLLAQGPMALSIYRGVW